MAKARRRARAAGRSRRTGDEARRAILAAAERRLVRGGPEAIRLQEIAADAGISHPAVLHHFGSREQLVAALVEHAMQGLQESLLAIVENRPPEADRSFDVRVERVARMAEETHEVLGARGYARVLAWLVLSGRHLPPLREEFFSRFARALHATRVERRRAEGRARPALEETLFGAAMAMVTLLGDALFGDLVRPAVGLPADPEVGRRFRRWMAEMVERA